MPMHSKFPVSLPVSPEWLSDFDKYLIGEGTHERTYEKLGAHLVTMNGKTGIAFAVWAPNARQVNLIGDFNEWNPSAHPMHSSDSGIWTLFIPGSPEYSVYKYHITTQDKSIFDKSDPYGFAMEERPKTGSVVRNLDSYQWQDDEWVASRQQHQSLDSPISIYEVHLGSWKKISDEKWGQALSQLP